MTDPVALALARASAHDLLPERRADEASRVRLPMALVASVDLGPSRVVGSRAHLIVVEDARGERFGVPAVLVDDRIRRALPGDGVSEALLACVAAGRAPDGLTIECLDPGEVASGERAFDVDQTNDLVVVGERAVVKWFLHPTDAPQPAPDRLAALARAGFEGTPRPWALARLAVEGSTALVAAVVDYLPNTTDGWEWAVDDVRSFARDQSNDGASWVRELGILVAGMHAAFAASGTREASRDEVASWYRDALADLEQAPLDEVDLGRARSVIAAVQQCTGTPVMAVHGDLHVGQVLRSADSGRLYVIDFDGNPTLTPEERVRAQPSARDIAGMLASLDHVGRVVLHRTDDLDQSQRQRVLDWIENSQVTFLDTYELALGRAGYAGLFDQRLLLPFQVQQECREYAYASRYLPHWSYVPDAALPALLDRGNQ